MRGALVFVGASVLLLGPGVAGASADAQEIGTSPATRVVAQLPLAVSVTFDKPIRASGYAMRVVGRDGLDNGSGAATVFRGTTLRRDIRGGAPNGPYQINWEIVAGDGHRQSGSFAFVAAHGSTVAAPAPTAVPVAPGAARATGAPSESARAASPAPSSAPSSAVASPSAGSGDVAGPFTPGTDPREDSGLRGALGEPTNTEDDENSRSLFTYLPLGLGAVLVIAAGLVSLVTRRRNAAADSERDRSPLTR